MLKHHVFLLHGITDESNIDKDYKEFSNKLRKQFKSKYKSDLDDYIELVPIRWEQSVRPAEQALFQKCFGRIKPSDKVLVSHILNPIEQTTGLVNAMTHTPDALQLVTSKWQSFRGWRYLTTMMVGDIIAYVDENDNQIRRSVWNTIRDHLDKQEVPPFSIIGHGLGSVIAYDFLFALLKSDGPHLFSFGESANHKLLEKVRRSFENFYSLGSPISLFLLRKSRLAEVSNARNNGGAPPLSNVINPFKGTTHKWLNFVDTDDIIAYPVQPIFNVDNELEKPGNPRDVFVTTGWLPPFAHTNYWRNQTIANEVVKQIKPEKISAEEKQPAFAGAR